jgi:hypothetical protein
MTLLDQYNALLKESVPSDKWPGRTITDKGTVHCYVQEYYNKKFTPLKNKPIKLLELGVEYGYSMKLWLSWFTNADFIGIDPFQPETLSYFNTLSNCKGIEADGFADSTVSMFEDNTFDFIIEDGPHTLESQIFAATKWPAKLKSGGVLIMEDLQNPDSDVKAIAEQTKHMKDVQILFYDFRSKSRRHDDVIIEITKK